VVSGLLVCVVEIHGAKRQSDCGVRPFDSKDSDSNTLQLAAASKGNQEVNRSTDQDFPPSCVTIISDVVDADSAIPIPSVVFMKCKYVTGP
jgi:hypothetical protein